ncbi:hypothetical protein B296_00005564 [Ensete ventricosum]|uniref:Uncharacterized protein n=1 Tax=Ensete ventricosum TaxID=4639 RepID=A0A426Z917_ENSVE|nr:hypothetical protein B296_00005564 [Ensete ventricosum]
MWVRQRSRRDSDSRRGGLQAADGVGHRRKQRRLKERAVATWLSSDTGDKIWHAVKGLRATMAVEAVEAAIEEEERKMAVGAKTMGLRRLEREQGMIVAGMIVVLQEGSSSSG